MALLVLFFFSFPFCWSGCSAAEKRGVLDEFTRAVATDADRSANNSGISGSTSSGSVAAGMAAGHGDRDRDGMSVNGKGGPAHGFGGAEGNAEGGLLRKLFLLD